VLIVILSLVRIANSVISRDHTNSRDQFHIV
jgi:hypothetical protein